MHIHTQTNATQKRNALLEAIKSKYSIVKLHIHMHMY